jgi:DNA mismatch endonuclease (patch repair protein)
MTKRNAVRLDPLTPQQRSCNMSRIRGCNTGPELMVRSALHARGLRFRLHAKGLPGTPDIVFPARRAIIFIHGCFWHGHDCPKCVVPRTNKDFWKEKIARNRNRDSAVVAELQRSGWRTLNIWECALRGRARLDLAGLIDQVAGWLTTGEASLEIAGTWPRGALFQ